MIIGITGGTGCGKTTLLSVIRQLGGTVLDCDKIYHDLLHTDPSLSSAIEACFPGTVENGVLNRKKLGKIVFNDADALLALNTITHSAVREKVLELLPKDESLAAIDAIGLFEAGLDSLCHITVAVTAPTEARIQRLMTRDAITRSEALARMDAQQSQEYFTSLCRYRLHNDGTQADFYRKCLAFCRDIGIIENKTGKGESL